MLMHAIVNNGRAGESSLSQIESNKIMNVNDTMMLFRPVGPKELELIRQ